MGLGLRRRLEDAAAKYPPLRRLLTKAYMLRTDHLARGPNHPLDRYYGVKTQSHVPLYLNMTGSIADEQIVPYGGCVASVLRNVLNRIDRTDATSFLDIGCGKGRALIIASEYAFSRIVGIELNPDVAGVARANAGRVARRFPNRTSIEVGVGDASIPDLPEMDMVIFMYHPFGAVLVDRLCKHLAEAAANRGKSFTVIYENPVHGAVFDDHPEFKRVFAAMLPCEDAERTFAFDDHEAIVVWRVGLPSMQPEPGSARGLRMIKKDFRVVLQCYAQHS